MNSTSGRLAAFLLAAAAFSVATVAAAQTAYPDRPIRMIVPYTPGGQFDIHARLLADKMKDILGQPVVVENRPGGASMVGADAVAKAPNDGYTLLFGGTNMFAVLPYVYRKVPYKVADFQTVSLVSDLPMALTLAAKQIPANNLKEFIAYVKARPGTINFGTSGTGGLQHLMGELANQHMGLQMVQVSYRGTPEVITGLLSDTVSLTFDGMAAYLPHTGPGKPLKILGVSSSQRVEAAPDVPTFEEQGFPQMTVSTRGGVVVPAGTPRAIVDKLHDAVVAANNDSKVREAVVRSAVIPRVSTPEEYDAIVKSDTAILRGVIDRLNLKLD